MIFWQALWKRSRLVWKTNTWFGVLHITMTNVDLEKAYPVEAVILGKKADEIKAEIVTGHMQDKNTFEAPETVGVQTFDGVQATKEGISFTIPACIVLHIAVK